MHTSGLSSQSCTVYLGQDPLFYPLMGSVWGNMGPRHSAKGSAGGWRGGKRCGYRGWEGATGAVGALGRSEPAPRMLLSANRC